jgi:hypothetical protein
MEERDRPLVLGGNTLRILRDSAGSQA